MTHAIDMRHEARGAGLKLCSQDVLFWRQGNAVDKAAQVDK
jgi:hypothetical protein